MDSLPNDVLVHGVFWGVQRVCHMEHCLRDIWVSENAKAYEEAWKQKYSPENDSQEPLKHKIEVYISPAPPRLSQQEDSDEFEEPDEYQIDELVQSPYEPSILKHYEKHLQSVRHRIYMCIRDRHFDKPRFGSLKNIPNEIWACIIRLQDSYCRLVISNTLVFQTARDVLQNHNIETKQDLLAEVQFRHLGYCQKTEKHRCRAEWLLSLRLVCRRFRDLIDLHCLFVWQLVARNHSLFLDTPLLAPAVQERFEQEAQFFLEPIRFYNQVILPSDFFPIVPETDAPTLLPYYKSIINWDPQPCLPELTTGQSPTPLELKAMILTFLFYIRSRRIRYTPYDAKKYYDQILSIWDPWLTSGPPRYWNQLCEEIQQHIRVYIPVNVLQKAILDGLIPECERKKYTPQCTPSDTRDPPLFVFEFS